MTLSRHPPWIWPRAAYIHVPFCAHRCGYCDFAIAVGQDELMDSYLDAIAIELAMLGRPQSVQSLFLGGGTPTYLSTRQLERLLGSILFWLPPDPGHEFSIEANPDTLDEDKIAVLADHGVNRISLGAQSFQPHLLRVLNRVHAPQEVPRVVERARRRVPHVSLDLIFGVPGQSLTEWQADIEQALRLPVDHISTYGLTYEKGTPLWKQRQRGEVEPLGEEEELAQYAYAIETLEAGGFEHYEISNFSKPHSRCRHNEVYWANEAYFGFGMGAARYQEGRREVNTRDLRTYLHRMQTNDSAAFQREILQPRERALETLALGLRRMSGVQRNAFHLQTGFALDSLAGPAIVRNVQLGLLDDDGQYVTLSRQGQYVADSVITGLLKEYI